MRCIDQLHKLASIGGRTGKKGVRVGLDVNNWEIITNCQKKVTNISKDTYKNGQ